MDMEQSGVGFATTRWSIIERARSGTPQEQEKARDELVRLYWAPIYSYLRRQRQGREQAQELTQAFFARVVIGSGLFSRARADRGSLRGLMLVSLKNFVRDSARRERVRGAHLRVPIEAIDREEAMLARHASLSPDELFDRRWKLAIVNDALSRCRTHYERGGKDGHWRLFEVRVLRPLLTGGLPPPMAMAAKENGFKSPADAAAAIQTVKRRVRAELGGRIG